MCGELGGQARQLTTTPLCLMLTSLPLPTARPGASALGFLTKNGTKWVGVIGYLLQEGAGSSFRTILILGGK